MAIELYPHQLKAIKELKNGKVLCGGVGVGKTITSIAYYYTEVCGGDLKVNGFGTVKPFERPMDLYVITTARKRDDKDWEGEASAFALSSDRTASWCGVQVTVDSWQNIAKYAEVKDAFFIFDEQRLVGSGTWVKAFLKLAKANQWILLSATPGDSWMDYVPLFVANGFYKNRTEFVRRHVVYKNFTKFPQIDRYVDTGILYRYRKSLLVDMPYERHTKRHIRWHLVEHDKELFKRVFKDRWNIYEHQPIKDVAELYRVMRKLVNSDKSRLRAIAELHEKHPRLIIFYNYDYELNAIRTMSEILDVEMAEWNGHKHEDVPEGDSWLYLVQYTAGAEAWNCISTDAIIFYSMNYSYKINYQAQGRIDRMNTPYTDLYYYILRSNSWIDNAIAKAIALKKDFNEKDYELAA